MFDKIIQTRRPHWSDCHPSHVKIEHHEHRAPTDESVRLLEELETRVRARILAAYNIKTTALEAKVIIFDKPHQMAVEVCVIVNFNAQVHEFSFEESQYLPGDELLLKVRDALGVWLATHILADLCHSASTAIFTRSR